MSQYLINMDGLDHLLMSSKIFLVLEELSYKVL